MKMETMTLNMQQLNMVCGGAGGKSKNPSNKESGIDGLINGDKYDAIAQKIADKLNGHDVRSREVNNNVNIYDTVI